MYNYFIFAEVAIAVPENRQQQFAEQENSCI